MGRALRLDDAPVVSEHFPGEIKQFMQVTQSRDNLDNPSDEDVAAFLRRHVKFTLSSRAEL